MLVETESEFVDFLVEFQSHDSLVIPIFTDVQTHPALNTIAMLHIWVANKTFILPFQHPDSTGLLVSCLQRMITDTVVYTVDKKQLLYFIPALSNIVDLKGVEFVQFGRYVKPDQFYTATMRRTYASFRYGSETNNIIPLMQLIEYGDAFSAYLKTIIELYRPTHQGLQFHNNIIIPATFFMERSGICVDLTIFNTFHPDKLSTSEMVFTEYNPYTTTHRITSRFNGINFSSMNKTDGERKSIISRFNNGSLVLIDFEGFHLRLIAELIDFKLPENSVHTFFAQQYYTVDIPSAEQYEDSKKLSFRYLYSTKREGAHIPFFAQIYNFIDKMWLEMEEHGSYTSSSGMQVRLDQMKDPTPSKAFNYLLQLIEMEVTMGAIATLEPLYNGKASRVTLYTYDSLLIDFTPSDGREILDATVKILECGGKYPVRVYRGKNYNELVNITHLFKK